MIEPASLRSLFWFLFLFCVIFVFESCTGRRAVLGDGDVSGTFVPAGVDTTVAREADSLSKALALDPQKELESKRLRQEARAFVLASDSLWSLVQAKRSVSQADSLDAIRQFNQAARYLREIAEIRRSQKEAEPEAAIERSVLEKLQSARSFLEKAVALNPFDLEARSWLARVYQSLASRFADSDDQERAIEVLVNLVRLEKGEHSLYRRLGEAYFSMGLWEEAFKSFVEAEHVLRETAYEAVQDGPATMQALRSAPVDTATLFYYVYYQAVAQTKLRRADEAVSRFQFARELARKPADRQSVEAYIDWINWDDGNIAASEKRDSLLQLAADGRYAEAVRGLNALTSNLTTRAARDEIEWRAAVLEYQMLDKKSEAVARLQSIVSRKMAGDHAEATDSTDQRYFESYGTMCHNLGLEHLAKNRQAAFAYFLQSVRIPWSGRAKSYLEVAKLSQNSPESVVDNCLAALRWETMLDQEERAQAYRLLTTAYKRLGHFDKAREYYAKWLETKR